MYDYDYDCIHLNGYKPLHQHLFGTMYGPPVHFWTPMNPISSICDEMKETIKKLPDKIDYIKEYVPVDFLIDKKKKLVGIVITLEEIIDKRQKEKVNNNM